MNTYKHIEINIGKACNNKCRFCMSSKPELWDIKFSDLEVVKEKLHNYYNTGYRSV
jgi:2-iminoacetate synthase ThiH